MLKFRARAQGSPPAYKKKHTRFIYFESLLKKRRRGEEPLFFKLSFFIKFQNGRKGGESKEGGNPALISKCRLAVREGRVKHPSQRSKIFLFPDFIWSQKIFCEIKARCARICEIVFYFRNRLLSLLLLHRLAIFFAAIPSLQL